MRRWLLLASLALGACTVSRTPNGVAVAPAPDMPPPNLVGGQKGAQGWDGNYAGRGFLQRDPGGTCDTTITITNMQVVGNQVTFGSFSGTIQPNGYVDMPYGPRRVYGTFGGGQFQGEFWQPFPGCTYAMRLSRG